MLFRDRIKQCSQKLTATERKLSSVLLLDYPFAGLEPIQTFAKSANTSQPTVSRFVTKLGFNGYQDFQRHLIGELKEGQRSPIDLQGTSMPFHGAFLADFVERAKSLIEDSMTAVSEDQFERVCGLLSDPKRSIYMIGGRISGALGLYLFGHLRLARSNVYFLPSDPDVWPEYLLRMRPNDILFVVEFRRYEQQLEKLAQIASTERDARVVLVTDKWLSPISKQASEVLAMPTENNTLWDSYVGALLLMEAIMTRVTETNWEETKDRLETWDSLRLDTVQLPDVD